MIARNGTSYCTVRAYAQITGIWIPRIKAQIIGKQAKRICQQRDIEIQEVRDIRWGTILAYPSMILYEVFRDLT
jgi:hypothetical protein